MPIAHLTRPSSLPLRPTWLYLLRALLLTRRPLTFPELAAALQCHRRTVRRAATLAEREGWVTTSPLSHSARRTLQLTAAGARRATRFE